MRSALDALGLAYTYVDIHADPAGRQRVREINAGYESVPTLIFPDGSTLTEPTFLELQAYLERSDIKIAQVDRDIRSKPSRWTQIKRWLGL